MDFMALVRMWIFCSLLQLITCGPAEEICWSCLSERSSRILASDPSIQNLTLCNPGKSSAALASVSVLTFDIAAIETGYSTCSTHCGPMMWPLVFGEVFEVSARAIMKCALRSLGVPAVAYSLRAKALRCMLVALRLRKPFLKIPTESGSHRDVVVYMGPPHQEDLRGKRGPGNWAEFKLSLQVAPAIRHLVIWSHYGLQQLRYYWPSAAHASLVILHEGYGASAKQDLQNAGHQAAPSKRVVPCDAACSWPTSCFF
jgi:hypothetical protein